MGELITIGKVESKIFQIRGRRVMLDEDFLRRQIGTLEMGKYSKEH
jgi:hypothetical protein